MPASAPTQGSRFLRLPAVTEMTGLSKSEIYRRIQRGQFPKNIKLGPATSAWHERDILEWQTKFMASAAEEEDLVG